MSIFFQIKKFKSALTLLLFVFSGCAWSSQGWGKVTMSGSVVDTACNIDMNSRDQTVNMGELPVNTLNNIGYGPVKNFDIKLTDCHFERYDRPDSKWNSLMITFGGPSENDFFSLSGEAKGIKLLLSDEYNSKVIPGTASLPVNITPGTMYLRYNLQIIKNSQTVTAGNYWTLLNFKIDYN
ncbi:TPA: fimbrial protein [Morganella morganii]